MHFFEAQKKVRRLLDGSACGGRLSYALCVSVPVLATPGSVSVDGARRVPVLHALAAVDLPAFPWPFGQGEVIPRCGFGLHFAAAAGWPPCFRVPAGHLRLLLGRLSVQTSCWLFGC